MTQENSLEMGVFTLFVFLFPLFLPQQDTVGSSSWLDHDSYSGVQPLALLELEEEFLRGNYS